VSAGQCLAHLRAVAGGADHEAGARQLLGEQDADVGVIVDDEQPLG
jgi:hypothetical protein